ncbi:lipid-A-disaccharide synthase [Mesonia aquimarina]|uniref:lipid-A-disaccharide synthase n=1 Tax=Mesonia aquimarina TaxID=1504967 RepID=UPI000EF63053|nr:lipid-A-disaccharide synthase [Mesonia aquimarina]
MKYYLIAGEASGDLHASNLMKAIKVKDSEAEFRFWGGDLMQNVGGTLVKHYRELAFMGFVEVIFNLKTILKNISVCKKDIATFQPDVILFIDYPGFNFRIAKWAKEEGYKTHYYISPQIWAWKENRIKAIKRDIDKMYVILPFEKDFYEEKHQFPVHFVGHPLLDAIEQRNEIDFDAFVSQNKLSQKPIIALLPGSRKQEISKMLKTMLKMVDKFPDYQFVIAGAPSQDREFYTPFIQQKNVFLLLNKTYDLLSVASAALVTSGTATLETALFNIPEVVCYKGSTVSYEIAKRIIKLNYISLVNLIMNREVVKELIQHEFNAKNLEKELHKILGESHRKVLLQDYKLLKEKLGGSGASKKTAQLIIDNIR